MKLGRVGAVIVCVGFLVSGRAWAGDPEQDLVTAVRDGDAARVSRLLKDGADAMAGGDEGESGSAAARAIWYGDPAIVKAMMDGGVDFKKVDSSGWNGLDLAMYRTDPPPQLVKLYLDAGLTLGTEHFPGLTALMSPAATRSVEIARLLIERGEDVNELSKSKHWSPLTLTAEYGSAAVVELLLEKGADPQLRAGGRSAIHCAAGRGGEEAARMIRALLKSRVDVDRADKDGWTPLMYAAGSSGEQAVAALIDGGADVNKAGVGGLRPLHVAAIYGNAAVLRQLIAAGAKVNERDDQDRTALMWVLSVSDPAQYCRWVRRAGAGRDLPTGEVAILRRIELQDPMGKVRLLLQAKSDVNAPDESGWTPLMLAAFMWDSSKLQSQLRGKREDGLEWDQAAWDAFAAKHNAEDVVKALIEAGAERADSGQPHGEMDVAAQRSDEHREAILGMIRLARVRIDSN